MKTTRVSLFGSPRQHGVQVVAEILGRRLDADGADGLGGQGIDREGMRE
jgi:hypothetical protein